MSDNIEVKELYAVVETLENNKPCVTAVPKRWIIGKTLFWPNTIKIDRKNPTDPIIDTWMKLSFKILKDNIGKFIYN